MVIDFTYLCQVSDEFTPNISNLSQVIWFEDLTICWSVHAGWVDGDVVKSCFKGHVLCIDPERIMWCTIVWFSWMGPGRGPWWMWWSWRAVGKGSALKGQLMHIGSSLGKHLCCIHWQGCSACLEGQGSMLLLSLSHRYTSPLWWSITYLSESKYGINNLILTMDASCPLFKCPYLVLVLDASVSPELSGM